MISFYSRNMDNLNRSSRPSSHGAGSMNGDHSNGNDNTKKKIPLELTAYGTTPSGKPRLFVCQMCTRAFARLEHLRRHERSHTKEKPFSCGVCQRKFSRRDLLLRHAQKLHAGCADAITRLRRKSVKKVLEGGEEEYSDDEDKEKVKKEEDVNFNLNLFGSQTHAANAAAPGTAGNAAGGDGDSIHSQINQLQQIGHGHSQSFSAPSTKKSRKNSDLSKSVFNRGRGASFSAQSGQNYAANIPEFNDLYTGTDNVEFSTPQLGATHSYDEHSWLNNLSTIPGMNDKEDKNMNFSYMLPTVTMKTDFDKHRSNSATSRGNHKSVSQSHSPHNTQMQSPHQNPSQNLVHGHLSQTHTPDNNNNPHDEFYGYSFYDIPESMTSSNFNTEFKLNSMLTPIKQEFEDDTMHQDNSHGSNAQNANTDVNGPINTSSNILDQFDLNLIGDIGDLTHELDVGAKFMPNGYSFYGDNPSSSSNMESPGYNSPNPQTYLNQSQILNIENVSLNHNLNSLKISNYSKSQLFTNNLKAIINRALNKYPINGISNPIIPSNERLSVYLDVFVKRFLHHYPFIHPSKLNEQGIMLMTSNEDYSNESSRACLPLLIATIGALLSNNKSDSEHLYEASRRTIHIYLESRKLKNDSSKNNNPLWLIQSLTLSVIYGLFSDNENNVFIVIRQLNALNSLVKTSIENADQKGKIYFTINPQEYESIIHEQKTSVFSGDLQENEMKFNNSIHLQSQTRIIFTIYRLTSFLLIYYNIPLTLSINDLNKLELPNRADEVLWNCATFTEFQDQKGTVQLVENFESNDKPVTLYFKDLLLKISKNSNLSNFDQNNQLRTLKHLSSVGISALVHGIFEINQFNSNLNTVNIINNLSMFLKNDPINIQITDYGVMANFIKISSLINFKYLKQQSWLKNHNELIKNYELLIKSINLNEFSKIDKVLDYSLSLLNFVMNKSEKFDFKDHFDENGSKSEDEKDLDDFELHHILNTKFTTTIPFTRINLVLIQSLFHTFTLVSILWIKYLKFHSSNYKNILTVKFQKILNFVKAVENDLSLNSIYKCNNDLSFYDILYFLNIGEMVLSKIFNEQLNFAIFDKLSFNLFQIRKYLISNESKLNQ